jgi:hypothetical protein
VFFKKPSHEIKIAGEVNVARGGSLARFQILGALVRCQSTLLYLSGPDCRNYVQESLHWLPATFLLIFNHPQEMAPFFHPKILFVSSSIHLRRDDSVLKSNPSFA